MEIIIYCRPRHAILKFANRYPNQTAFSTTLYLRKFNDFVTVWYARTKNQGVEPFDFSGLGLTAVLNFGLVSVKVQIN